MPKKTKLTNLSKGVESLKEGCTISDIAMVAGVPMGRVRYQVKILAERKVWQPVEEKIYLGAPAAGKATGVRLNAARALYNLVTLGQAAPA